MPLNVTTLLGNWLYMINEAYVDRLEIVLMV